MLTVKQLLLKSIEQLQCAEIETAALDARILIGDTLGVSQEAIIGSDKVITPEEESRIKDVIGRRIKREPVSHIIGRREFWGMEFKVNRYTLDPRPDSETLVEAALTLSPNRIADLGTGTGCLLLALLKEFPKATGIGIDISPEALQVARENAHILGLSNRSAFKQGNWGEGLNGAYDLIISNPPYIKHDDMKQLQPEVQYEPQSALDGGEDGLDCYRIIVPQAFKLLTQQGWLILECGEGQAKEIGDMLEKKDFKNIAMRNDLAGIARCVLGQKLTES